MRDGRPYVARNVQGPVRGATPADFPHSASGCDLRAAPQGRALRGRHGRASDRAAQLEADEVELVQHVLSRCWEAMERSV